MNWKDHQEAFDQNQKLWDKRTAIHLQSKFYDNETFLQTKDSLRQIESNQLSDLKGKRVLHLQCHFGQDSISLAERGASVVGIDLSPASITAARELNDACGSSAEFHCSNVYDIRELDLGLFDIVFTSYGTICWLPDLHLWAKLIQEHLKPTGSFYMVDFHPILYMIEWADREWKYPYFGREQPFEDNDEYSYTENKKSVNIKSYFWQHPISEILSALLSADLKIRRFQEYDYSPYDCFPLLTTTGHNEYKYLELGINIPHLYEIEAVMC